MCPSAHRRDEVSASCMVRSRTSLPETGEAVVAMRILDCERLQMDVRAGGLCMAM